MYWYLRIKNWLEEQKGQDLTEYALLLVLIVIAAVVAVTALGGKINSVMSDAVSALGGAS